MCTRPLRPTANARQIYLLFKAASCAGKGRVGQDYLGPGLMQAQACRKAAAESLNGASQINSHQKASVQPAALAGMARMLSSCPASSRTLSKSLPQTVLMLGLGTHDRIVKVILATPFPPYEPGPNRYEGLKRIRE